MRFRNVQPSSERPCQYSILMTRSVYQYWTGSGRPLQAQAFEGRVVMLRFGVQVCFQTKASPGPNQQLLCVQDWAVVRRPCIAALLQRYYAAGTWSNSHPTLLELLPASFLDVQSRSSSHGASSQVSRLQVLHCTPGLIVAHS